MFPLMVRFLATLYTHQRCQIQWCNQMAEPFTVRNGVKQGGVLSPALFTVYVDELLATKTESFQYGMLYRNTFLGSFGYADDIIRTFISDIALVEGHVKSGTLFF